MSMVSLIGIPSPPVSILYDCEKYFQGHAFLPLYYFHDHAQYSYNMTMTLPGSCTITVDRRIAPPPAAPERGVKISLHTAPQCPETLSRRPTGRSSPCFRLFAS